MQCKRSADGEEAVASRALVFASIVCLNVGTERFVAAPNRRMSAW